MVKLVMKGIIPAELDSDLFQLRNIQGDFFFFFEVKLFSITLYKIWKSAPLS